MNNILVFKAAHDLKNCVDFTDVAEELIAQPLPFTGTFDYARDVDKLQRRGKDALRLDQRSDAVQTTIRNRHDPFVGLDGAKRIIGCLCSFRAGECIKKRALANVR